MTLLNRTLKYIVNGKLTATYKKPQNFYHQFITSYYIGLNDVDGEYIFGRLEPNEDIPKLRMMADFDVVEYKGELFLKIKVGATLIDKFVRGEYTKMYSPEVLKSCAASYKSLAKYPFFTNAYNVLSGNDAYRKKLAIKYNVDPAIIKELDDKIKLEEEIYDY